MPNASNADRQAKIYFRVKELVQENNVIEVASELEDWGSDFSYYDVYTEGPENFFQENGFVPKSPLNSERRKFFKENGFSFHKDGSVSYSRVQK